MRTIKRHRPHRQAYPGSTHIRRARPHPHILAALVIGALFIAAIAIGLGAPTDTLPLRDLLPPDHPGYTSDAVTGYAGVSPAPTAVITTADAFRACATKALAGDFGPLPAWKRNAYERGLHSVTVRHALITVYGPWEGYGRNKATAHGYGCSEDIAAANRRLKHHVIWVSAPPHLRRIGDTGAPGNDAWAHRKGCDLWVDLWIPKRGWLDLNNTLYKRDIVIIDN